jgi:type I restriction enzyme M protein
LLRDTGSSSASGNEKQLLVTLASRKNMSQLQGIEAVEKRLWNAADTLRTNSNYASNEYFMPVMGLIFLRHAYSRYLAVKDTFKVPSRGGKPRPLTKEDFSQKAAIFLQPQAQFDYLVALTDADDRAAAIIDAMDSIESDYENLKDQLPKAEYRDLDNEVLGQLLRTLNPEELKNASGDIFGHIYEYFLTGFADLKAHDGGEFFTPVSLVQLIVNVIEPDHGKILDPACGSGGMFVQSAHFVERLKKNPGRLLTFYGMEKNPTTIRLAKMNLAVHGLEGNIQKAITYYEDPHEKLWGNVDFVMANPPFNTDEIDAEKVRTDRRLPFGLPGENKNKKVSNGNYLWMSYFYSYLNDTGRAGFVMSSQASSAGGEEAKVRQAIIKTGHVDAMIDIRSNFFYTRSVPCQLWFFNKNKPKEHADKVLMIDARNVYRKVTRKIYDFSPEHQKNLTSIIWLYRGENDKFLELVKTYIEEALQQSQNCFTLKTGTAETIKPFDDYICAANSLKSAMAPFFGSLDKNGEYVALWSEFEQTLDTLESDIKAFKTVHLKGAKDSWNKIKALTAKNLSGFTNGSLADLAAHSRDLIRDIDLVYKLIARLIDTAEKELNARDSDLWNASTINGARKNSLRKDSDAARAIAVSAAKLIGYFFKHAHWLTSRFPDGKLADVEGLVKLVGIDELQANDYSLTPGRYVGVAPELVDEDFDFEETLRDIHIELAGLNEEAAALAEKIAKNFEELGI